MDILNADETEALAVALRRLNPEPAKSVGVPMPTGRALSQATEMLAKACLAERSPFVTYLAEGIQNGTVALAPIETPAPPKSKRAKKRVKKGKKRRAPRRR